MELDLRSKLAQASAEYAKALRELQKLKTPNKDILKKVSEAKQNLQKIKNEYLKSSENS